jgi:transcriptional regulator with XRE-family HTH domain
MATLGETDISLAQKLGVSRQTVHNRRTGRTAMTADDMAATAQVLGRSGVDPVLLLGPPHEAVAWLAAHRADELDDVLSGNSAQSRCTASKLNHPLSGAKLLVRRSASGLRAAA